MPAAVTDSAAVFAGSYAGRMDARRHQVIGRGFLGFIGGVPIGSLGLLAFYGDAAVQVLSIGGGLGLIVAAAEAGSTAPPDTLAAAADSRGPVYARAYRTGYAERLRSRRRVAAYVGGGIGAATSLGFLIWAISQIHF